MNIDKCLELLIGANSIFYFLLKVWASDLRAFWFNILPDMHLLKFDNIFTNNQSSVPGKYARKLGQEQSQSWGRTTKHRWRLILYRNAKRHASQVWKKKILKIYLQYIFFQSHDATNCHLGQINEVNLNPLECDILTSVTVKIPIASFKNYKNSGAPGVMITKLTI
jgi:hypothetical protein